MKTLVPPPITPGTWDFYWRKSENGEADCGVTASERPGHVYSVCRCPRYQTKEKWEADGRFLHAAPAMAEALANLLFYSMHPGEDYKDLYDARAEAHDVLLAAGYTEAADQE